MVALCVSTSIGQKKIRRSYSLHSGIQRKSTGCGRTGAVLPSGTGLKFRSGPVLTFFPVPQINIHDRYEVTSQEDESGKQVSLRRHGACTKLNEMTIVSRKKPRKFKVFDVRRIYFCLSKQARLAPKKKLGDARPDADGAWRLFHNVGRMNEPPAVCAALLLHFALALECMTGPVATQVLVRHDGTTLARSHARLLRHSVFARTFLLPVACPSCPIMQRLENERKVPQSPTSTTHLLKDLMYRLQYKKDLLVAPDNERI